MKKTRLILFLASCCSALAQVPISVRESGFSDQYKSENTLGEYSFGYNEDHTTGGSFRRETSDRHGNKFGSYGLRVGDGRVRIVNYVADQNGFRADVISNEPGVESQNSNQFSKFTKENIYSVLVPGFKYSPLTPHVAFESSNQQDSRIHNEILDRIRYEDQADGIKFNGGDFSNVYRGVDMQEDGFPSEDMYVDGQMDSDSAHENADLIMEDPSMDDDYIYDFPTSETQLDEKTGNASTEIQKTAKDSISNSSSAQKDDFRRDQQINYEDRYGAQTYKDDDDSYPLQSTIVMKEINEPTISQGRTNATVNENSNEKNATNSDITKA